MILFLLFFIPLEIDASREIMLETNHFLLFNGSIIINNSIEFHEKAEFHNWEGKGISDDPYVIKNLTVDNQNIGIHIRNSDVYFIIENVIVTNLP